MSNPSTPALVQTHPDQFTLHMREAIALNRARAPLYAERTHGASRWLSRMLVASEIACLPLARYFDHAARPFNAAGVGVVADDFVSMSLAGDPTRPPRYTGRAERRQVKALRRDVATYTRDARRLLRQGDFRGVARLTATAIEGVEAHEARCGAHFAMTIHLMESVGRAAANAPRHMDASGGASEGLSRRLVGVQLWCVSSGVPLDRRAQRSHALGVGILVNDVPPIPFSA
ncbi:MAG: hypothetical protein CMH57_09090 [Myxococcales bacterium]|nr:hypothetical protein [Myxococcales bacterium]